MEHIYAAIDLKCFYASVECAERHLDPLTTNLVVADTSRTEKTICLAVSPSLKAYGIPGRARLFEVIQRVKEINSERLSRAIRQGHLRRDEKGEYHFVSSSFSAQALKNDPALALSYITAPPRMRLYEEYSTRIYSIYLRYIAPEDIHVYSIDEVFIDLTRYLHTYGLSAQELVMTMIREVLYVTGITATAGIGSNLYLAKIAMDIVAKHMPPDKDGVRLAVLDEKTYREQLWCHRPLTDFWRVGRGYSKKLEAMGLYTMGDIARASLDPVGENILYKQFGINAELLIDHAWGWEPTTIEHIKHYHPQTNSVSSGQVLKEPYDYEKGRLIIHEMTELLVQDLVRKGVVTKQLTLTIGYDRESLTVTVPGKTAKDTVYAAARTGKAYTGKVTSDPYGRAIPGHSHGMVNLEKYTNSTRKITAAVLQMYDGIINEDLLIRRVTIAACGLIRETEIPPDAPEQLDLFTDYSSLEEQRKTDRVTEEKERNILRTMLSLQDRYGKNVVLKGMNFVEGGTTIERNGQIGGHKA